MKKLLRQEKVIFRASKKQKKMLFADNFFTISLSSLALIATVFIALELIFLPSATANQPSTSSSAAMSSTTLMLSSTPPPNLLEIGQIENALTTPSTAAATSDKAQPDYCLDVPVVLYHHIQPLTLAKQLGHAPLTVDSEMFDEQMKYLKKQEYTTITSSQLVQALLTRSQLPEKSIMVTIDDGYDDNYTYAFLTAKKHHVILNFMIPTGLIGKPGYMNWDHLREMSTSPYARLYNHTTTHAPLGMLDRAKVEQEVADANTTFRTQLGINNDILTYPYGSYNEQAIEAVKSVGIKAAFTTDLGTTHCLSNILKLPRVRVGNAPISEYGF